GSVQLRRELRRRREGRRDRQRRRRRARSARRQLRARPVVRLPPRSGVTMRKLPRPFKMHWGEGQITEEASFKGEYHEAAIQLLEYHSGGSSIRFCYFNQRGQFQQRPLMVRAEELSGLARSLKQAPKLRRLLSKLVR